MYIAGSWKLSYRLSMMSNVFRDFILFHLLEKTLVLKVAIITLESTYMPTQDV